MVPNHREGVMNQDVIVTCAVTGAGDTTGRSPHVPVTPKEVAEAAETTKKARAAYFHRMLRDPETGQGLQASGALNLPMLQQCPNALTA